MISTKRWCGGTKEEYETQHFGFGVQRLHIAIRHMVEEKITSCVRDMDTYLQESLNLNDTDKATVSHSCEKLIRLYCERAGPSLEIIDTEIEKILSVPPNTLLPEDEVQSQQVSEEEYNKLKGEVVTLLQRVERGALMEALLIAEEEEISSAEKLCEMAKKDMDVLDLLHKNVDCNDDVNSIQNDTQVLCSDLPFMDNENYGLNLF